MNFKVIYFNNIVKKLFICFCTLNINLSNASETYISLDHALEQFSSVKSIHLTEKISPLINPSAKKEAGVQYKGLFQIEPILKEITLTDQQYTDYTDFLAQLIKELNNKKISVDWNKVNSLKHNECLKSNVILKLNEENKDIHKSFNKLIKENNVSGSKGASPISNLRRVHEHSLLYNLKGSYAIAKSSYNLGNVNTNNHELIINIEPGHNIHFRRKISEVKIILTFEKTYNILKNETNIPVHEEFKLSKAVLIVPHILQGTDMQNKIAKDYSQVYSLRNLIKTYLTFKFDYQKNI